MTHAGAGPTLRATILGMAVVTAITRSFFLFARRERELPEPLQRALQVAPLAAIVAVARARDLHVATAHLVDTWRDARLPAALAATLFYAWRPGVLGPLIAGLALYLPLRLVLGW